NQAGADQIPSAVLVEELAAIEGRPWAEWGRQRKPISPNQLANLLRRFEISPSKIRFGDKALQGYNRSDFKEAFERYLPKTPSPERNTGTTPGEMPISGTEHPNGMFHPENESSTRECSGVPLCKGEALDLDIINRELAATAELLKDRQPDEDGEV